MPPQIKDIQSNKIINPKNNSSPSKNSTSIYPSSKNNQSVSTKSSKSMGSNHHSNLIITSSLTLLLLATHASMDSMVGNPASIQYIPRWAALLGILIGVVLVKSCMISFLGYKSSFILCALGFVLSLLFHFDPQIVPLTCSGLIEGKTMFARDVSTLFRNEMKPFYWFEMTLARKLTNRMDSFHFGKTQIWSKFSIRSLGFITFLISARQYYLAPSKMSKIQRIRWGRGCSIWWLFNLNLSWINVTSLPRLIRRVRLLVIFPRL